MLVKQLDGAWDKAFQMVRNNPGSGRFKISRYDAVGGNGEYIADDNLVLVKVDGNPLFKWIIESRKPDYVDASEQQLIEVSGRGVLSMLNWAVVFPEEMGSPVLDRPFSGTASTVLRTLILEAQARGGLVGVSVDWEDDRDSLGKPFETYFIGDWIGWNIAPEGSDALGFDGVLRVCGITVSEDNDTGALSYTLELHDTMLEHEIRLNQKVERMSQYSGSDVLSVAPSSSGGYSDSEVNAMLAAKANVNHLHTGVYAETDHTHDFLALTDTPDSFLGQGTNVVAVKADGSGLEFVTSSGGSGGTTYENPIDEPPAIPHAMDDEFTDTVTDDKWSWINQGTAAWSENGSYGAMDLLSGGDHTRLLVQQAPAGDFTVTAKLTVSGPKANYYNFGLCLYNSANSRRIVFGKCCRSGYSGIQAVKFSSNTAYSSDAYLVGGWDSTFIYVRIRKVGTSYYLDLSTDGDFWWQVFAESISAFLSVISHVGVGYFRNNSSGVTYKGRCEWFRVTEP